MSAVTTFFVEKLSEVTLSQLKPLMNGYETTALYEVNQTINSNDVLDGMTIQLKLVRLNKPVFVEHNYLTESDVEHFSSFCHQGLCFGCFRQDSKELCGFLLAEYQEWNDYVMVREFQIGKNYRRLGLGMKLFLELEQVCVARKYRCIVCESQVLNYPALQFYKKLGFTLDGIDLSFYSNDDYAKQNIAVFMKKKLLS